MEAKLEKLEMQQRLDGTHLSWRKCAYGIGRVVGYENFVVFDRDYDPIAELPDLKDSDLEKFHAPQAGKFHSCAFFYNDGCSPGNVGKTPQYKDALGRLQQLNFRKPVEVTPEVASGPDI
jgi:hypothetical protein